MYHMDLIVREGQHFIVKCPQYPAWSFKQHGNRDQLKDNANASLLAHVTEVATFQWWGWVDRP